MWNNVVQSKAYDYRIVYLS